MDTPVYVVFDMDGTLLDDLPGADARWVGRKVQAIPGALDTLRWCREQGYQLVLYSMGDLVSRLQRLDAAGIPREWFRYIYAPGAKTLRAYETILAPLQRASKLIYVGDSWRNDIAVALGRADGVIWPRGTRVAGKFDTPADLTKYPVWVVNSVAEIPKIMPRVLADAYRGQTKAAWEGYWEKTFGAAYRQTHLNLDATGPSPRRGSPRRRRVQQDPWDHPLPFEFSGAARG